MKQNHSQNRSPIKNEKIKQNFGKFIQKHRKDKGMTQQALADALGISVKSVCYFERGSTFPSQENIFKIAELLDMSLDEFIYGESIFDHSICIQEINDMLLTLSGKEQGMVIKMLKSTIETIIAGRES